MRRLSGLDSAFLALETTHSTGHVGGLSVLDASTAPTPVDLDRLHALYSERLPLVPTARSARCGDAQEPGQGAQVAAAAQQLRHVQQAQHCDDAPLRVVQGGQQDAPLGQQGDVVRHLALQELDQIGTAHVEHGQVVKWGKGEIGHR